MSRVLLALIVGAVLTGCASLGVRIEGVSGPLAWHVTDLKSDSVPGRVAAGEAHGAYSLTLVLKETQGIPITFTYRKDTIYASNLTVLRTVDQAINFRLRPYEERRVPLTFTWGCASTDCVQVENVALRWTINLTGTDNKGSSVKAVINMNLPPNPDTYRKP